MLIARTLGLCMISLITAMPSFSQLPKHIFNEMTEERFDRNDFTISTKEVKQHVGVYHFGESEGEWELVIIPYQNSIIIQMWSGAWAEDMGLKEPAWLQKCKTFNVVKLEGNKFYFDQFSGHFAEYKEGKKQTKTLLLFGSLTEGRKYGKDSAEVGFHTSSLQTHFDGERFQLSSEIRPEKFFASKSKQELKSLRNTVYANYGLLFQKGGEMDRHFRKQDWYRGWRKDVSECLTEIEKINLATLKKFEQTNAAAETDVQK